MAEPLKLLFSDSFVKKLATGLHKNALRFNSRQFTLDILEKDDWENKELKERMHRITHCMFDHLNGSYSEKLEILRATAPDFTGITGIVFPNFVEHYGLNYEQESIEALAWFTRFSTSEFAIRPFLKKDPTLIQTLYEWAKDENHHVRRLASEGSRPLLPWAMRLDQYVKDPSPVLPILEKLRNDPEDYVYRSVANNLNDLSKHHPELVLELARKWHGHSKTTDWVLKHALRTLLKKGNPDALEIFGFRPPQGIQVNHFSVHNKNVQIGDSTVLEIELENTKKANQFRIEYVIHYCKKNGSQSAKVFQISEKQMKSGEQFSTTKKLDFRDLTTRKHYPGKHLIALHINGKSVSELSINLK